MLVIMDMEWVDWFGRISPSQLAALRVGDDWKEIASFQKLICPELDWRKTDWKHVAFTGYQRDDFLRGSDASSALALLDVWLRADDVLCWWSAPTAETFAFVWKNLMHEPVPYSMRLVAPAIKEELLGRGLHEKGSAYGMAKAAGLEITEQEHCSVDDVSMIRRLLRELPADPEKIRNVAKASSDVTVRVVKPIVRSEYNPSLRYVLDKTNKRAHILSCGLIPSEAELRSMGTIDGVVRSKYPPCDCCSEEYWVFSAVRARESIRKRQLNYIYSDKSGLFHKPTCVHVQHMPYYTIHGAVRYETALWSGHRPCGFCKPGPEDEKEPLHIREYKEDIFSKTTVIGRKKKEELNKPAKSSISRYEMNALKRQEQAKKEKAKMSDNLTGVHSRDAFVLTQAGFAFWMAEGYQTFHLRNCPKLNGLSHLHGYARFNEAYRFGRPCKYCKPSPANDIIASVPMNQQIRPEETVEQIDALCESLGLKHESKIDAYYIETPVAYWKLMVGTFPLEVHHMPKDADYYHKQHRTFLSMTDTVEYIRRHDDVLLPAKGPEAKQETCFEQRLRETINRLPANTSEPGLCAMESM